MATSYLCNLPALQQLEARECPKSLWLLLFSSSSPSLLAPHFIPAYPVLSYPLPPTALLLLGVLLTRSCQNMRKLRPAAKGMNSESENMDAVKGEKEAHGNGLVN